MRKIRKRRKEHKVRYYSIRVMTWIVSDIHSHSHLFIPDATEHLRDVRNTVFMSNLSFDVDYEELLTLCVLWNMQSIWCMTSLTHSSRKLHSP